MAGWRCAIERMFSALRVVEERTLLAFNLTPPAYNYDIVSASYAEVVMPEHTEMSDNDGIVWMAVPKKRTSLHKRRLRNQGKQLKNLINIEICHVCGNTKLRHILCQHCSNRIKKETREYRLTLPPLRRAIKKF